MRAASAKDNLRRGHSLLPHRPDRRRAVALGEAAAGRVGQQRVMAVARGRQAEQRLQNAVDMRRHREILAAGHQGDALDRVVDRDREMVARRQLLAGEHDIAEHSRGQPAGGIPPRTSRAGRSARARGRHRAAAHNRVPSAALRRSRRRRACGRCRDKAARHRRAGRRRRGRSRPGSRAACKSSG